MEVKHMKKIILTKEEQRVIHDLYKILNEDNYLNCYDVWDILTDIYENTNDRSIDHGYSIKIVD